MDALHRHLTHLLCCIPAHRNNDENDPEYLSSLQQPASTLSVPLPHTTVPHSSSESYADDARALHHIFSSSSSIRGYQTAATTPGYLPTSRPSLDRDFHFSSQSPQKNARARMEKLGRHIRQKLSESRLSKASSKEDASAAELGMTKIERPSPVKDDPSLGVSHSTTGITELLASRNVSQGGYDSDAHSLKTPLVRSNAGTLKIASGYVRQTLGKMDQSENPNLPISQSRVSPTIGKDEAQASLPSHGKAKSSPFPSTPSKTSFSAALEVGPNESPSDVLRRLSVGLANGTIKMPHTPELRAMRMPSLTEVETGWRVAAPQRSSSLKTNEDDIQKKLKTLSDTVVSLKRESIVSGEGDDKRASLISELDPALISYMSRYAERASSDETQKADGDEEGVIEKAEATGSSPVPGGLLQSSKFDAQSVPETDKDSVHLMNMRISQRLASQSKVPMISPSSSKNASTRSLAMTDANTSLRPQTSEVARYPKWIASEHNRRPSDPKTRRLFEVTGVDRRSLNPTWKTVTATGNSDNSIARPQDPSRDDASSFYWSENGMRSSGVSPASTRRNSIMNSHSLAVGGRSFSAGLPNRQSNQSIGQLSTAAESAWLGQKSLQGIRSSEDSWVQPNDCTTRGRSVSLPKKRFGTHEQSPTPFPKRFREATSGAEGMSQISLEGVLDHGNEGVTELATQELEERKPERFSDIEDEFLHISGAKYDRSQANDGDINMNSSPNRSIPLFGVASTKPVPHVGIQESATSVWERAFRHAKEDTRGSSTGGFLTAPEFDREGRRRSTRASMSEAGSVRQPSNRPRSPAERRRSRSAGPSRQESVEVDLDLHQRLCFAAKTPLLRAGPVIGLTDPIIKKVRSQTLRELPRSRKKSILDVGRRFAAAGRSSAEEFVNGTSTPTRELFGIWSRFPGHTKEERTGAATISDGIKSRDFQTEDSPAYTNQAEENTRGSSTPVAFKILPRGMHKKLSKAKSKSMTLRGVTDFTQSPAERARRNRKGIVGKWRKLYRGSSSELRKYAVAHGHRSSFSLGDAPEYPELECLPAEGMVRETELQRWRSEVDGGADAPENQRRSTSTAKGVYGSDVTERAAPSLKPAITDWSKYYGECVGSLSGLKSDTDMDVRSMSITEGTSGLGAGIVASPELRDSTVDFQEQLGREQERAKEELMEKIGRIGQSEGVQDTNLSGDAVEANHKGKDEDVEAEKSGSESTDISVDSRDIKVPGGFE